MRREVAMRVYFFIADQGVRPSDLDSEGIREEDKAIVRRIEAKLVKRAEGLKCGTHGQEVSAIVSGPSFQQLGVEIQGCCEDFLDTVSRRLNPAEDN
jgi:hypothetical protein